MSEHKEVVFDRESRSHIGIVVRDLGKAVKLRNEKPCIGTGGPGVVFLDTQSICNVEIELGERREENK